MSHTMGLLAGFHIFIAFLLVVLVLVQDSKGGGIGGAFGSGSSQTLFGATGATTFFAKVTRVLATIFMLSCLGFGYLYNRDRTKSVVDSLPAQAPMTTAPQQAPPAPQQQAPAHQQPEPTQDQSQEDN